LRNAMFDQRGAPKQFKVGALTALETLHVLPICRVAENVNVAGPLKRKTWRYLHFASAGRAIDPAHIAALLPNVPNAFVLARLQQRHACIEAAHRICFEAVVIRVFVVGLTPDDYRLRVLAERQLRGNKASSSGGPPNECTALHQAASLQVGKKRPNPLRAALCRASTARSPAANRVDPFEGLLPSVPSGLSNRTFPWMKRVPS